MAIPRQVQKQLKEVEALEKALQAQIDPSGAEDSDKKEEKATKVKPDTEILEPTEAELVTESVKVKPADTSPTGVEDDFKQKYNTLRGKYDAEVPRLHQQVKQLSDELGSIRKEITAKKDEPTKPKEKVSLVTDADREEFGEDLLNVQRKVAQEVSQEYEGRFERQEKIIQDLQDKVAGTDKQVGEVGFSQRLVNLVPDFAQVDNDERWVAWLNEHDPMLRAPRRVQAQTAFDSGDAEAIADYIKLWKSTLTETANESEKPIRQIEFEKQVAPNRSATSVKTPTNQSGKYYSARDMDSAWVKVRTLNTRGKYDDAAKLEAELTAAYMENRVRA
jgi:hypothetical protein|tara:strand:- start:1240 stop:2238 length:999 start_codon:yes stop_codon:yes gene_type:complete